MYVIIKSVTKERQIITMAAFAVIIALCAVPGVLAGIFHFFLIKEDRIENKINTIAVYIAFFYGVLSLVQMIRGYGPQTLTVCFRYAVPAVYLHYIPLLVLLSAIIPLLMKLLSRYADISRYISLFASVMFTILSLWFIVFNRIYNTFYVAVMAISALLTFWGINYYKGEILFFTKDDVKRRIRYAVPVTLFHIVTVMIFLPGTLYLGNRSEISFSASSLAAALLAGTVIQTILIAGAGIVLLTRRQFDFVYTVLFAVTLSGYVQSTLLNGHMQQMDGGRQTWQGVQLCVNFLIWIILIACIVLIKRFVRKNIAKIYSIICIYLCLVQIVSLGYMAVRTYVQNPEDSSVRWVLSKDGQFTLHPDNNVIVFVLDWYDEQILEKVLREDEGFLSSLDGFTRYTNATSLYAFTAESVPYLLTGVEWQYDMSREEYVDYAYANSTMMNDIHSAGYDIGIYTDASYISRNMSGVLRNYMPYTELAGEQNCDTWNTIELMSRCSKYQTAPFGMKNWYWYSSDGINALRGEIQIIYSASNDIGFWSSLNETGLKIDQDAAGSGNYRFYHLRGAHPPYQMSEDFTRISISNDVADMISQAKGSMKIVLEYIEQLKKLDLYDSATIIITADHGQHYLYVPWRENSREALGLERTSNPILLVKKPGDTWEGIRQSCAPVSQTEVVSDIVHAINPQAASKYGRTLQEIGETEDRTRTFIFWRADFPYVRSVITGNARDESSWTIEERLEPHESAR